MGGAALDGHLSPADTSVSSGCRSLGPVALRIFFGFGACHRRTKAGVRDHSGCRSDESFDPEQHCAYNHAHAGSNVGRRILARVSLAASSALRHAMARNLAFGDRLLPAGGAQRGATNFDLCLAENRDLGLDRAFSVAVAAHAS